MWSNTDLNFKKKGLGMPKGLPLLTYAKCKLYLFRQYRFSLLDLAYTKFDHRYLKGNCVKNGVSFFYFLTHFRNISISLFVKDCIF